MLTIKAPIEIAAKTSYVSDLEEFYYRTIGNYSLIETPVNGEDLLHLSTTPPEIYVEEGSSMTSLIQSSTRNEANIQKVEILNNVLNRIVMSADAHLTYQDRVFITDALYKLGIRDDRRFMNAFYRMAEETKNTNTLINLYLEKGMELREMVESIDSERIRESETETETRLQEKENFLYERVLRRLKTGAIYQIVSNFNHSIEETEIDKREYSIANQSYAAQHILLSVLRERSGIAGENLTYLNSNIYEESIEQTDVSIDNVKNEMNAAVLMDMIQNLYHTGFDRFYLNDNKYYRFEDVFFGASLSTLQRLTSYQGDVSISMHDSTEMLTENNFLTSNEIDLLTGDEEGHVTEEELINITRTVNELNVTNERRRREYMRALERIRTRERGSSGEGGMSKTREAARLALSSPEALAERLSEEETENADRDRRVLEELAYLFPEESVRIYEILNEYRNNPQTLIENNIARPAQISELIHDINVAENGGDFDEPEDRGISGTDTITREKNERLLEEIDRFEKQESEIRGESTRRINETEELVHDLRGRIQDETTVNTGTERIITDTERLIERIDRERTVRRRPVTETAREYESVPTIHKVTETLSEEELEEQLNVMRQDLTRQIRTESSSDVVTQTQTNSTQTIVNNEQTTQTVDNRMIQQMINEGVRNQVSAISNQVFRKLESQMRNEKIRRGY